MTLYQKQGRRYLPVSDTTAYDGLRNGAWLVIVEGGRTAIRRIVHPDHAAVEAAMLTAEEAMVAALRRQSDMQPQKRRLTPRERRAWEMWKSMMGEDSLMLTRAAAADIVEAGLDAVRKAMGMLTWISSTL